jgi:NAD+ kinase
MRKVGLIYKQTSQAAVDRAAEAARWLRQNSVEPLVERQLAPLFEGVTPIPTDEMGARSDFVVCLGGDGTLLYAAGVLRKDPVPVLGVHMGTLGFLTPFLQEELEEGLQKALAGELETEERIRLSAHLTRPGQDSIEGIAANDVVISQGSLARLLELEVKVDGEAITRYKADGLIIGTPTGSTAYNLAAGGPIMTPELQTLCLTPICPHSLNQRPLLLPASSRLQVSVCGRKEEAYMTVDGQRGQIVGQGDWVEVSRSDCPLVVYKSPHRTFFDILRTKLMWGERGERTTG